MCYITCRWLISKDNVGKTAMWPSTGEKFFHTLTWRVRWHTHMYICTFVHLSLFVFPGSEHQAGFSLHSDSFSLSPESYSWVFHMFCLFCCLCEDNFAVITVILISWCLRVYINPSTFQVAWNDILHACSCKVECATPTSFTQPRSRWESRAKGLRTGTSSWKRWIPEVHHDLRPDVTFGFQIKMVISLKGMKTNCTVPNHCWHSWCGYASSFCAVRLM